MGFDFSVQLFAVRDLFAKDALSVFHQLKDLGYIGVEGYGPLSIPPDNLNNYLLETGLKLAGWHIPFELLLNDNLQPTIDYLKNINNKYVIVPWLSPEYSGNIDSWRRTAEKFNELSKILKNEGMTLGYHNHDFEFNTIDGKLLFTEFFDNTDPDIVVQMDNGNAMSGNGDVMTLIKKYPGRFKSVHLKPYSAKDGYSSIIGEDDTDWKTLLHWYRDFGGTEHYIVEYEDEKTHPQIVGVELCLKALKKMESSGKI